MSEYGTPYCSVGEPGMPLMTSLLLIRPNSRYTRSPARPNQFARIAIFVVGWAMTAGVHSTVWIFATSAALIRRARWKISSSDHCGYSARSRSQMALCSRVNRVCIMSSPIQNPGTIRGSSAGSSGSGGSPSGPTRSLPSVPLRTNCWYSAVVP